MKNPQKTPDPGTQPGTFLDSKAEKSAISAAIGSSGSAVGSVQTGSGAEITAFARSTTSPDQQDEHEDCWAPRLAASSALGGGVRIHGRIPGSVPANTPANTPGNGTGTAGSDDRVVGGSRIAPPTTLNSVVQMARSPELPEVSAEIIVRPLKSRDAAFVATKLISLGFPVFWLKPPTQATTWVRGKVQTIPPERRGKSPAHREWNAGPALSLEQLQEQLNQGVSSLSGGEPGYNVGIRTGWVEGCRTRVIGIDLDSAEALAWGRQNLPETEIRTLTRKGEHWYYTCPGRGIRNKVSVKLPNSDGTFRSFLLDIRGDDGILVAPASIHGTGHQYRAPDSLKWTPERVSRMPVFDPGWFGQGKNCEWVDGAPVLELPGSGLGSGSDSGSVGEQEDPIRLPPVAVPIETRRRRGVQYLNKCEPCVAGEGTASNLCLYIARVLVWGLCLPPEDAAILMLRHEWNKKATDSRGAPYPWSAEELLHKCREANRRDFGKPYGWLLAPASASSVGAAGNVSGAPGPGIGPGILRAAHAESAEKEARESEQKLGLRTDQACEDAEQDAESLATSPGPDSADLEVEETQIVNPGPGKRGWRQTDSGNAERLVARFGDSIRFVEDQGLWRILDRRTGRWLRRGRAMQYLAKLTAQKIVEELPDLEARAARAAAALRDAQYTGAMIEGADGAKAEDERARKAIQALIKWQSYSEGLYGRKAMIELAQSERGVGVNSQVFDADPYLLGVRNGVLNLRTLALSSPDSGSGVRSLMMTQSCAVGWNPEAKCPTWERCLRDWTGGGPEGERAIGYLRRIAGYVLTGDTREQCVIFFWGAGSNGKSTFVNALLSVLGGGYARTAPIDLLMETKADKASPSSLSGLADLASARFVVATETEEGNRLSAARVKQLRSSEPIKAKFMGKDFFEYRPRFKIIATSNPRPVIKETDEGTWRSVRLVRWGAAFKGQGDDKDLEKKLLAEREGILRWMAEGCLEWQRIGLSPPERFLRETAEYRESQDTLGEFLRSRFEIAPEGSPERGSGPEGWRFPRTSLRSLYEAYCEAEGYSPIGAPRMKQELELRGILAGRSGREGDVWRGLRQRG